MSVNPAESEIWGSLYGTREMREIFSDHAQLQCMLDVEAALARAQAKLGLVPAHVAAAITAAARVENVELARIAASTRTVGYPVVSLVKELGREAKHVMSGTDLRGYFTMTVNTMCTVCIHADGVIATLA